MAVDAAETTGSVVVGLAVNFVVALMLGSERFVEYGSQAVRG